MNSCYVLIKETNLDPLGGSKEPEPYRAAKTIKIFNDFESAKQQMRSILTTYATTYNSLFDGEGNILHLDDYLNYCLSDGDLDLEETELYLQLPNILRAYFLDEEPDDIQLFDTYTKYGIAIDEDWGIRILSMRNSDDLPGINYYDIAYPNLEYEKVAINLAINSFHMDNPEKTYICRINGEYETWDKPFFLYLELRKIEIE